MSSSGAGFSFAWLFLFILIQLQTIILECKPNKQSRLLLLSPLPPLQDTPDDVEEVVCCYDADPFGSNSYFCSTFETSSSCLDLNNGVCRWFDDGINCPIDPAQDTRDEFPCCYSEHSVELNMFCSTNFNTRSSCLNSITTSVPCSWMGEDEFGCQDVDESTGLGWDIPLDQIGDINIMDSNYGGQDTSDASDEACYCYNEYSDELDGLCYDNYKTRASCLDSYHDLPYGCTWYDGGDPNNCPNELNNGDIELFDIRDDFGVISNDIVDDISVVDIANDIDYCCSSISGNVVQERTCIRFEYEPDCLLRDTVCQWKECQ